MRYASYLQPGKAASFGVLAADGKTLSDLATGGITTLRAALAAWGTEGLVHRAAQASYNIPVTGVRWLPPITDPAKIICVGVNYRSHAAESARAEQEYPSLFVRFADSLVGHGEPVLLPRVSSQFDYEAELAVIIGRPARDIGAEQALSVVAGYACFAENSVRDFQKHAAQVTAGKNFHASGAFGPYLTSADEVADVGALEIVGRLNGEVMQRDYIGSLIFSVPELISYISSFTPLAPGDVIVTGTPAGVGVSRRPPVFMKDGDVFEVDITGVGLLRNIVCASK